MFPSRGIVTVEGCRTRSGHVRGRRVTATVVCGKRVRRLTATISATKLAGTFRGTRTRRFTARRTRPGVALGGHGKAIGRVRTVDAASRHALDVARARDGTPVVRTEILLTLAPAATVAQVNAALSPIGGRIVSAIRREDRIVVGLPDPGGLAVLDRLIAGLRHRRGIRRAERSELAAPRELPRGTAAPPTTTQAAELSHLLAARVPAAWNARRAIRLADRPTVIVLDSFGNGLLSRHVDATYDHADLLPAGLQVFDHGYRVVSIIAGDFVSDGTAAGRVAGVFPATTKLHVFDAAGLSVGVEENKLLELAGATPGHVVANTSFGWARKKSDADAIPEGADWARHVRAAGLERRLVQTVPAGNTRGGTAGTDSSFAASARTDLQAFGQPVPPLAGTLTVENVADSGAPLYVARCLDQPASSGGIVSAVGKDVYSLDARGRASSKSGSSFSAPLVAGLAEYLWSIAPDLTASQIAGAIRATARPASAGCPAPSPAASVDAYAAVLSLDGTTSGLSAATDPVRLAILDVNRDGTFDAPDVRALAPSAFATTGRRDWSRQDLNGDGVTGGNAAAPFDLDPRGSVRAGPPSLGLLAELVGGVAKSFDETRATDADVLCYYAYSPLYTGDPTARDAALLGPNRCAQPFAPSQITLGSRTANLFIEAHATAGGTTIPSAAKSFTAPGGTDPMHLQQSLTSVDADATDVTAGELHTHAEGQIDAAVGPTTAGGVEMSVSRTASASRMASGAGPFVGSATASGVVSMRVSVQNVPAHLTMTSNVTGQSTFTIQENADAPFTQPNGTVDTTIEPGSWSFNVSCNAVAISGNSSRSCGENVDVTVDPIGTP